MEKIIVHGSPCQDFSLAGKQAGGDKYSGTRSSLLYETVRIVEKIKPKYVIWENVKNVISKKHRHNFDNYLQEMEKLGYINYYQVINAKDQTIPQNRERVFTISILGEHNTFEFPTKQELKLRLKDLLEEEVDEKYYLSNKMFDYILDINNKQKGTKWEGRADNDLLNPNIYHTLGVRSAGGNQRAGVSNFIIPELETEIKVKDYKATTICLNSKGGRKGIEGLQPSIKDRVYDSNGLATCVTTADFYMPNYTEKLRIRKLTPKECWRLMGFDDVDFEKAQKVNSNAQLYKQAGNSIVVNVLEAIFNNLLDKNEKYELIELFGGIGSPRKALQRQQFNFKSIAYVEIDKYAVKSYNTIYDEYYVPADITTYLIEENENIESDSE